MQRTPSPFKGRANQALLDSSLHEPLRKALKKYYIGKEVRKSILS
jgi:hypothetical protein